MCLATCVGNAPDETITIPIAGETLPLGAAKNRVDESFTFFAGTTADTFTLTMSLSGLSGAMRLETRPGDGGSPIQTIATNGTTTATFPGNIGVLRFVSDGLVSPVAGISIVTMTMHRPGRPIVPAITSSRTGQATSMPMTLNTPVELFFPAAPSTNTFFMTVSGVAGKTVDIVADGPARLLLSSGDFVLPEAGSGEPGGFTTPTGSSTTVTMNPGRDTLFLTFAQVGPGHTRVSVNEVKSLLSLRARYVSLSALSPTQAATLTSTVTAASAILYNATMGRVRIGTLTILSRIGSPGSALAAGDIAILPPAAPAGVFTPPVNLPDGVIVVDMAATGPSTNPRTLAAAILNSRFGVALEPPDGDGSLTCPNSLMNNPSMAIPTLCWRGNHNPFGSSALGAAAPTAAWDTLAAALGIAPPAASPVHVLRALTPIAFPMATTIVP